MNKYISFKFNVASLIPIVPVLWILVSDHYNNGSAISILQKESVKFAQDDKDLGAAIAQTNSNVSALTASCMATAGKLDELSLFIHTRQAAPPPRYTDRP